jgi:tetratricopeptide (TPR) repeat protein
MRVSDDRPDTLVAKHRAILEAITAYTESNIFQLDAHCASITALTTEPFESDPVHPLCNDMVNDVTQSHIFRRDCLPALRSYISFLCRRDVLHHMELNHYAAQRRLSALLEAIDDLPFDRDWALNEEAIQTREQILAAEGDTLDKAAELFKFTSGWLAHGERNERLLQTLLRSAARRGRDDIVELVFDNYYRAELTFDELTYLRIAEACWRQGHLALALQNIEAFDARIARGDFDDGLSPIAPAAPKPFTAPHVVAAATARYKKALQSSRWSGPAGIRDQVQTYLMRIHFDLGNVVEAEAVLQAAMDEGREPSDAMLQHYILGHIAVSLRSAAGEQDWKDVLDRTLGNPRFRSIRFSPAFWGGLIEAIFRRVDDLAPRADVLYTLASKRIEFGKVLPLAERTRHLDLVLDSITTAAASASAAGDMEQARHLAENAVRLFRDVDAAIRHVFETSQSGQDKYSRYLGYAPVRRLVGHLAGQGRFIAAAYVAQTWAEGAHLALEDAHRDAATISLPLAAHQCHVVVLLALGEWSSPASAGPGLKQLFTVASTLVRWGMPLTPRVGRLLADALQSGATAEVTSSQLAELLGRARVEPYDITRGGRVPPLGPRAVKDGAAFAREMRTARRDAFSEGQD